VLPVALLELVVQVSFANGYGYHRDELYFRTAARHPAFGYDDQPPLTPLLGRLGRSRSDRGSRSRRPARKRRLGGRFRGLDRLTRGHLRP
jgi:hypothetical protein